MPYYRFQEIKTLVPTILSDITKYHVKKWWEISTGIMEFNKTREELFQGEYSVLTLDEIMSEFHPQTTNHSNLPWLA